MSKTEDAPILTPRYPGFTILVDTAEGHPYQFDGLVSDAAHKFRPIIVRKKHVSLGRHPHSRGDYSVEFDDKSYDGLCNIERKSREDLQGTLLGFPKVIDGEMLTTGRRDRFEDELENLRHIIMVGGVAAVVVESSMLQCCLQLEAHGSKPAETWQKILNRSIQAMMTDWQVPWFFCDNRKYAQQTTFQLIQRFVRHRKKAQRAKRKAERKGARP